VSWVAAGASVAGVIAVADAPRAEAREACRALQSANLKVLPHSLEGLFAVARGNRCSGLRFYGSGF